MTKLKKISENSIIKSAKKKKFNKNSSFSGVDSKISPKNRRKSLATVLPTPLKQKKKKEKTFASEWTVNEIGSPSPLKKKRNTEKERQYVDVGPIEKTESITNKNKNAAPALGKIQKPQLNTLDHTANNDAPTKTAKRTKSKKQKPDDRINGISSKEQRVSPIQTKTKAKADSILSISELQEKFNIKHKDVKLAVNGVIKFHAENPKIQNQLFQEQVPLFLQFSCHKLPQGQPRLHRIPLAHSILTPDDDVCLIVPEVKGIKNIEHEQHVEYYEDLLRKKGVSGIKKIMTCHEFRTEHETFEQKQRLADLYELFLVDGRISGKIVGKSGKIFYQKRKVPISVKLYVTNLKDHIKKALSKVFFHMHLKGDSYNVQFGHSKMDNNEMVENILCIIDFLNKEFPGGFDNIKGIQVYSPRTTSIPIYMSMKHPNDIKTPKIKPKKPQAYKTYKDELTTQLNAQVTVLPTGQVLVSKTKEEEDEANKITDEDIIQANKEMSETDEETQIKRKNDKKNKKRKNSDSSGEKKSETENIDSSQTVEDQITKKKKQDKSHKFIVSKILTNKIEKDSQKKKNKHKEGQKEKKNKGKKNKSI